MKKFFQEFKEFAMKGNVFDLAVAVIIGGAFTAIINSIVNDLFMPLIGIITGGYDISGLSVQVGTATLTYGNFISAVITFIIVALLLFLMVKGINKMKKKKEEAPAPAEPVYICEFCRSEVDKEATRCPHCASEITPVEKK